MCIFVDFYPTPRVYVSFFNYDKNCQTSLRRFLTWLLWRVTALNVIQGERPLAIIQVENSYLKDVIFVRMLLVMNIRMSNVERSLAVAWTLQKNKSFWREFYNCHGYEVLLAIAYTFSISKRGHCWVKFGSIVVTVDTIIKIYTSKHIYSIMNLCKVSLL